MSWLNPTEREKWASPARVVANPQTHLGLPALDDRSRELYEKALPRGVLLPRFVADRPPVNYWMSPYELAQYAFLPGPDHSRQIREDRFLGLSRRPADGHDRGRARRQDIDRP